MDKAKVYFIPSSRNENPKVVHQKLRTLLDQSGMGKILKKRDIVAIKIHCGEEGNIGHVPAQYLTSLVEDLKAFGAKPFLTDTNALYHGSRMNAVDHLALFRKHGFSKLNLPIIIADGLHGDDFVEIEINGKFFKKIKVAKAIFEADAMIAISHLTGHMVTGFGAAVKNIGMGCASKAGKMEQHSGVSPKISQDKCERCGNCSAICPANAIVEKANGFFIEDSLCIGCAQCVSRCPVDAIKINWDKGSKQLQQRMAEYVYGILKAKRAFFVTFASRITKDCDCLAKDDPLETRDIGILASSDPVAIDKAALNLANQTAGQDIFRNLFPDIDHNIQLLSVASLGMGTLEYELINLTKV